MDEHRLGQGAATIILARQFSNVADSYHKVLNVLLDCRDDYCNEYYMYLNFDQIANRSRVPRVHIRRITRYLARKGMAEYKRGLFDPDGAVAGAGYAATKLGLVVSQIIKDEP